MSLIGILHREFAKDEVPGTYGAVWLAPKSTKKLHAFFKHYLDGSQIEPPEKMHITTIYSRKPIEMKSKPVSFIIEPDSYGLDFLGQNKEYLVLTVKHAALNKLFNEAQKLGATWDYPEYISHISICTNFTGNKDKVAKMPLPQFPLQALKHVVEELKE